MPRRSKGIPGTSKTSSAPPAGCQRPPKTFHTPKDFYMPLRLHRGVHIYSKPSRGIYGLPQAYTYLFKTVRALTKSCPRAMCLPRCPSGRRRPTRRLRSATLVRSVAKSSAVTAAFSTRRVRAHGVRSLCRCSSSIMGALGAGALWRVGLVLCCMRRRRMSWGGV